MGGGVNLHKGFSHLALSANTECIDLPGCSIKIPHSSTQFSHLGWAWAVALLQEQWTKQMCFSMQLPPLSPVCLPVRDAEDFKTKYHHATYLWKQGGKLKGTWCRIKASLLFCAVSQNPRYKPVFLYQVTLNSTQAPSKNPSSDVTNVCYLRFTHSSILFDYPISTWQVPHFISIHDLSCLWHIHQHAACIFQWYKAFSVDNKI